MNIETSLKDRVALITGASRGIGKALAIGFAHAGASVACVARTKAPLERTVQEILAHGGTARAMCGDVTQEREVLSVVQETVQFFGQFDVLVVNAGGLLTTSSVEESDTAQWRQTLELNLFSAYYCMKTAIPYLKAQGGETIITLGSGLGHTGMAGRSAYACAKAGLWMLTRVLAHELRQDNISVNELIPGPVETGTLSEEFRQHVIDVDHEWLKRPEDVVPFAVFLASQPPGGPTAQSFSLMRREA